MLLYVVMMPEDIRKDELDTSTRPSKRPRMMGFADGFVKEKASVKISTPKFVSAFDSLGPSTSAGTSSRLKPSVKTPSRLSNISVPSPKSQASQLRDKPGDSSRMSKLISVRVLKPPAFPVPPAIERTEEVRTTRESGTITARRPVLTAPRISSSKNLTSIHRLQPRPITPPREKKKILTDLAPPPLPGAGPASGSLKSIFDTAVARATDFRSESGQAEVLSIYLQQHGHGFVDPHERELQRGLEQSPEKASKRTKAAKYARGGLAQRASVQFSHRRTALSLWQSSLELEMRSGRALVPDMHLRVTSVRYSANPADHQRTSHAPCVALVRCRVVSARKEEDVTVMLNFDGVGSRATPFNKVSELQDGREVYVWRPWNSITIPSAFSLPGGTECDNIMFCSRFWLKPA
ncbi:uncharacterized protein LAESUDRAFT_233552 [Laetiporus sulphureus 93-53]|uniref:Uncharacterized protein n=1 Tax=Laetiporus sulphureus 93-53 TaxID=1314785 RepID=A0A165DMK0_9APHY|nr:uncharacterized protein LAESUDRAFT_233552 [Laetiporus sulphureus 93-53]KZT05205.1 hypothetical protein LAESUDRAFT_233552 [Laetiporus sulphureus 93-53]